MEILVTGRLASLTGDIYSRMINNHKIVAASDDLVLESLGDKVTPFQIAPCDEEFEKIFHAYRFDQIIFFSQPLFAKEAFYREYQDLENCLRLCVEHGIRKVVYVQAYTGTPEDRALQDHDIGVLMDSCARLCSYYRSRKNMSVLELQIPCLFGAGEAASLVGSALQQAQHGRKVHFQADERQNCGFLAQSDLSELLLRITDSWVTDVEQMMVPPATVVTVGELGRIVKERCPEAEVTFKGGATLPVLTEQAHLPRTLYDWLPMCRVETMLSVLDEELERETLEEETGLLDRVRVFFLRHPGILKVAEVLLGFLVMEFLIKITGTTVQFREIDFRLLYVVMLATFHGMRAGLGAAALASLSLLFASVQEQNNFALTIYDLDTWLPFIFYFLAGTVTGYVKDRLQNDNKFILKDKAVLENKYILLNEFYTSSVRNKRQYMNQILSYKDSFGRLFDITRQLDSTMSDQVMKEAIDALESVLDNQAVCIYRCDEQMLFGRLVACSKEISGTTSKTLVLSKLDQMKFTGEDGEIWVNRERLQGYPEYAVPLYRDGSPIALIVLQTVRYDQMATYYENLVRILCGLVKISLVRALSYTERIESEMYVPGSRILVPEYFKKILQVREDLAQKGMAEYMVLKVKTEEDARIETADKLSGLIRVTDVIGEDDVGTLYLCLAQTNRQTVKAVLERIEKSGVAFELETGGGEA